MEGGEPITMAPWGLDVVHLTMVACLWTRQLTTARTVYTEEATYGRGRARVERTVDNEGCGAWLAAMNPSPTCIKKE